MPASPTHGPDFHPPIVLPTDWDAQKDCDHFEDRWPPEPTYTATLWRMMRFHGWNFVAALDASLAYFQQKDATLVRVEPRCLSVREKIEALQEYARTSPCAAHCRERLLTDLQLCEFVEGERARVLKEYRQARDGAWMYPVVEVIDYLADAGLCLKGTMQGGTDGFLLVVRRWQEEREEEEEF